MKYRVIERFREKYSIEAMCKVFGVSRSGYYDWRNRQDRPNKDQWLIDLITQAQIASKQTYGHRRIQRWLLRKHKKHVNLKVILRVMRRYDLLSKIRRVRPYMQYQKALHKYPNLLDRQFEQVLPNRFWVTDITYIHTAKGMVYMCAIMDLCGKMVLAYRIGTDMTTSLVTDTIRDAKQKEMVTDGLALHSDQGSQYTSQAYFDLVQSYHIQPSMSSPGCPYDNSAMENFFGNLKTECLHRMNFSCKAEVEQAVAEYVQFYNFERINMKNGLTPFEIRSKAA